MSDEKDAEIERLRAGIAALQQPDPVDWKAEAIKLAAALNYALRNWAPSQRLEVSTPGIVESNLRDRLYDFRTKLLLGETP